MNPAGILSKGLRILGSKGIARASGWIGALLTLGEIGWFTAKKGKLLEKFTHYYCEEGKMCGRLIPDEMVEKKLETAVRSGRPGKIAVKCPHCPEGRRTVDPEEWEKMKNHRKQWQ